MNYILIRLLFFKTVAREFREYGVMKAKRVDQEERIDYLTIYCKEVEEDETLEECVGLIKKLLILKKTV